MMIKLSKQQFYLLEQYELSRYEFGTKDGNDTDYLCVVHPNIQMDCSFNNDHLLFYKDQENKIDYLVCTPRMILHSIINGNCDLFYHMLYQGMFSYGVMQFLGCYDVEQFHSKRMFKSLLGVAKRDLKQLKKLNDSISKRKKIHWIVQYITYIEDMLTKQNIPVNICSNYQDTINNLSNHTNLINSCIDRNIIDDFNDFLREHDCYNLPTINFVGNLFYEQWIKTI